jgi:tetratricopeptide (TPR) repeat protein
MIAALAAAMLVQSQADIPKAYFEINSTYARACSQGAIAARKGTIDPAALEACTKALNTEPLNALGLAQTLTNRGVIRFAAQDQDGALRDFSAAIDKKPDYALAYLNRAGVRLLARDFEQARSDADRSLQLDNTNARAWLMRGGANEMLGRTAQAYKDYQMAAKLDPNWEQPKAELARFKPAK